MLFEELYRHFGSSRRMAKQLGLATQTPLHWKKIGYIPLSAQLKIEWITNGQFKADIHHGPDFIKQGAHNE